MPDIRRVAVIALLLQCGCASVPSGKPAAEPGAAPGDATSADRPAIRLDVDGMVPLFSPEATEDNALIASRVDLGLDDRRLRYSARYRVESGDLFRLAEATDPAAVPSVLAGQRFGQDVALTLPELAGAPVSLGVTAEVQERWQLAGQTRSENERAHLQWSPWRATLRVEWSEQAQAFDPSLALHCNLESSLGLPVRESGERRQRLLLAGRECYIAGAESHAGLPVRAWSLGWSSNGAARESIARVHVIEPAWMDGLTPAGKEPGYQLGLGHRRDFGDLSAEALVTLRQPPAVLDDGRYEAFEDDTSWSANASLTWHLPLASVSATWAQGVNPLWFVPDAPAATQDRDRFGLALDLSRWMEGLVPGSVRELGFTWDWSQVRAPGAGAVGESAIALDVAWMF
ncbi:MAG TPA: hypothetical protein VKZ85_04325 [Woeseiaceae bacterium]|nr:hypothetical protein [Woeseiaceae bacterium]